LLKESKVIHVVKNSQSIYCIIAFICISTKLV